MPTHYFDERIATSYREKWPHLFEREVVEPTVAGRASPDGAAGRDEVARAVERLEARAFHRLKQEPRVGLAEDAGGLVRVGLIRAGGKLGLAVGRSQVGGAQRAD